MKNNNYRKKDLFIDDFDKQKALIDLSEIIKCKKRAQQTLRKIEE